MNPPVQGPQLHDIHLPPPPSWWPPAPGWWIVAALLLELAIMLGIFLYMRARRRRRRQALMAEFERIVATAGGDARALAAGLSVLLRRVALRDKPAAAAMTGERWLRHLDAGVASEEFSAGVGRALSDAPFQTRADYDMPALIALSRRYLLAFSARSGKRA